jgi:hypothetical protein
MVTSILQSYQFFVGELVCLPTHSLLLNSISESYWTGWSTGNTCIWEVLSSNLSQDTGYPD